MSLDKVKLINLPKISDPRGNLSFFESGVHIPFEIQRTYWIYDVPGGEIRGSHAFKESHEFIVALSGSFNIVLNDGSHEVKYSLNRSYFGLYVPNLLWRRMGDFSTNSLALIVSSVKYDDKDYMRDYNAFKILKNGASKK